jgi:hypothetical protein
MSFETIKYALKYIFNVLQGLTMPFKSKAQQKYLFANKPAMAEEWEKETPDIKKLPNKVKKKKTKTKRK